MCELRAVSRAIAFKVAQTACDEGFGRSFEDKALEEAIDAFCWFPNYTNGYHHDASTEKVVPVTTLTR
jgi:hypothetical protein